MSRRSVTKPTDINIYDYCDQEIEDFTIGSNQWAHIIRGYIPGPTETATKLRFLWRRLRKPNENYEKEIVYDFHAACFDKLMREFKKEKERL